MRPANAGGKKGHLNACLDKGDKVFLFDAPVGPDTTKAALESATAFTADTGNMYTVVKVGTAAPSASTPTTEDRYYFVVDKAINWDGSATHARKDFGIGGGPTGWTLGPISQGQFDGMASPGDQKIGTVPVVKFEPGPTSYEVVRGLGPRLCNGDDGLCARKHGCTSDNCDQQSRLPSRKGAPSPALRRTRSRGMMLRGPASTCLFRFPGASPPRGRPRATK